MTGMNWRAGLLACLMVAMPAAAPAQAQQAPSELQELRDRAAIEELLRAYGRTIDERDFEAFGALFAEDGEYGSGPVTSVGPEAIAESMRSVFEANALGFAEPNFHVFFNEVIAVDGDNARASSMSFYIVPGEDGLPKIALMARYDDELIRVSEGWKFRSRRVEGLLPAPR